MDKHRQARLQFLLHKYVENKCSQKELDELFDILGEHPESKILSSFIEDEASRLDHSTDFLPEEISQSILLSLNKKLRGRDYLFEKNKRRFARQQFLKVAAAFLVVMMCTGVLFLYMKHQRTEFIEVKTAYGEIRDITLPDNSIVVLNGNSSVRYAANWQSENDRDVYLTGEGFFNVVHTVNHQKFNVHTSNDVVVEVLGTEFNVNDRRSRTQVVLQSGKVRLDLKNLGEESDILMSSGEYVEVSSDAITRKQVNTDDYTSWQQRKIIFKETPLEDVLQFLEDNYGVVSAVNDSSILQEKFTATYPSQDSGVLIKALERSFRIQFEKDTKRLVVGN